MTTEYRLWLFVFFLLFIILFQWVKIKYLKDKVFDISYNKVKNINKESQIQAVKVGAMYEILRVKRKFNDFRNAWYNYQQASEGWTVGEMSLWITQQDLDLDIESLNDFSVLDSLKSYTND